MFNFLFKIQFYFGKILLGNENYKYKFFISKNQVKMDIKKKKPFQKGKPIITYVLTQDPNQPKPEESKVNDHKEIVSDIVSNLQCLKNEDTKEKEKQEKQKLKNQIRREKKKEFKKQDEEKKVEEKSKKPNKIQYGAFSKISYSKEEVKENPEEKKKQLSQGHTSLTEKLISQFVDESYECLICVAKIKRSAPIWNCSCCFAPFHLFCIKKWYNQNQSSESGTLVCPQCRGESKGIPNKYYCFCGKVKDPDDNFYITPHSCGNICEKKRVGTDCPHQCSLLCHPGACPPCGSNRKIKCYCGQEDFTIRCSDSIKGKTCGQKCNKFLNCQRHKCEITCHDGGCSPCSKIFEQNCYCGKEKDILKPCLNNPIDKIDGKEKTYSCNQVCGKKLKCGNHSCQEKCHPGECKECSMSPEKVKTCPCGKENLQDQRKSCLDPIPTCKHTCGKLLPCGLHKCLKKCHIDECGQCLELKEIQCRCESSKTKVPCILTYGSPEDPLVINIKERYGIKYPFICEKICNTNKNCIRHKCKTKCCPSKKNYDVQGLHICHLKCGKKLNCGKHQCDLPCHAMQCQPCSIIIRQRVTCKCRKTYLDPPLHCGTKLPECKNPCSIKRECGHAPKHNCHDSGNCPPCMELVSKKCSGGHGMVDKIPCCTTNIQCGRACNKPLPCGLHTCDKSCHGGECLPDFKGKEFGCGQTCGKLLKCKHFCLDQCHPDKECKDVCKQKVKIYCECKHLTGLMECDELQKKVKYTHPEVEYNVNSLPPVLDCNSECRLLARNKRLAEAFNIDIVKHDLPNYSRNLISYGLKNLKFIQEIESTFQKFLDNSSATKYSFPHMNTDKRVIIHELSEFYKFLSASEDRKPYKSVSITKTIHSQTPSIRLSVVLSDSSKLKILEDKLNELNLNEKEELLPITYQKRLKEMELESSEEEEEEDEKDEKDEWITVKSKNKK